MQTYAGIYPTNFFESSPEELQDEYDYITSKIKRTKVSEL